MSRLPHILQFLGQQSDACVDQALAAALPTADADALCQLVPVLLQRRQADGLLELVRQYHRLPAEVRHLLHRQISDLDEAITLAARGGELPFPASAFGRQRPAAVGQDGAGDQANTSRVNAVRIIRDTGYARLIHLLTEQLRQTGAGLREEAAHGILELAHAVASDPRLPDALPAAGAAGAVAAEAAQDGRQGGVPPRRMIDAAAARLVQAALEEAVLDYRRHEHPAVLLAWLLLAPRPMSGALAALDSLRHPAVEPLRRLLRHSEHPAVRRAWLLFASVPTLTEAALQGLEHAVATPGNNGQPRIPALADVLASAHLLLDRRFAVAVRRIRQPVELLPEAGQLAQLPPHAALGLIHWLDALPLSAGQRLALLAPLTRLGDPRARLAALRRLIALANSAASERAAVHGAIAAFCGDAEGAVVLVALRYLLHVHWEDLLRLLPRLANSHHAAVRELAGGQLAAWGFARFWEAWPRLGEAQRLAAGRALIKIDARFHEQLSQRLAQPGRPTRLRALAVIHQLNQGALFEAALRALAADDDLVIAASAVRALGTAGGCPQAVEALEAALDHRDSRVRANAVEALQQLRSTRHVQKLLQMAQADDGRPRANAIHALLEMRTGEALGALGTMLGDPRSAQRISALWLVEKLGLLDVARAVADLAVVDPDAQVRQRAGRVVGRLMEAVEVARAG